MSLKFSRKFTDKDVEEFAKAHPVEGRRVMQFRQAGRFQVYSGLLGSSLFGIGLGVASKNPLTGALGAVLGGAAGLLFSRHIPNAVYRLNDLDADQVGNTFYTYLREQKKL